MKDILFFSLLFCLFSFVACRKQEPRAWAYRLEQFDESYWISDFLHIPGSDTCYLVGGQRYGSGALWQSSNRGQTWQRIVESEREFRSIAFAPPHRLWLHGIGGNYGYSPNAGQNWSWPQIYGWEYWVHAAYWPDGSGLVVAAESFATGFLQRIEANGQLGQRDSLGHGLRHIQLLGEQQAYALGYGLVLHSADKGQNWQAIEALTGDYFVDMQFPTAQDAYILGQYGSLYRSQNAGQSWQRIQRAQSLNSRFAGIQGLCFRNATEGIRVGGNGRIEYSRDAGESWQSLESPSANWRGVAAIGNTLYIYGSRGELLIGNWDF